MSKSMNTGRIGKWRHYNFRQSAEYRLGVRQLAQWHEMCRCKRLGIRFQPKKAARRVFV